MKEFLRKQIVGLKRRPQNICTLLLVICCMIYTFNLTAHSNASMYVSSNVVALYVFGITLLSMLAIFTHINIYAPRQKLKLLMQILLYIIILAQIAMNGLYYMEMIAQMNSADSIRRNADVIKSVNCSFIHIVALAITLFALITKPIYAKLLNKIDTTVPDPELMDVNDDDESLIEEEFEEFTI